MSEKTLEQNLEKILIPTKTKLDSLKKGDNLLVELKNKLSLLKYERLRQGHLNPLRIRTNRNKTVCCVGNLLSQDDDDNPYTHDDPKKRITQKARIEILGTHKIIFDYDSEFDIYLPSSKNHSDLYLTLANKFADGHIQKLNNRVNLITDEELIKKRLQEITRPNYFEQNILPFLENRPTNLTIPSSNSRIKNLSEQIQNIITSSNPKKPKYIKFDSEQGYKWLNNITQDLHPDDFVYVGSKEQVYLLKIQKEEDLEDYSINWNKGFWFSNNYLGNVHKFQDIIDELLYSKTKPPAGFMNKPFIFTAMDREQDYKNLIFTNEPKIITANPYEAIEHFKTTDFQEFSDIATRYINKN